MLRSGRGARGAPIPYCAEPALSLERPSLSIFFPAYNDAGTIASLVLLKELSKDKKTESTVLAVNVPLNVLLEPGIGLKFGNDNKTYPFKTCLEGGCVAMVPVDEQLEKTIAGTSDAAISVARLDGKTVQLPFSTKGFADARKAYKSFDAKRSSWWWRLWS